MTLDKDLKDVREYMMQMFARRVFQTEGIASTKALGQELTQNV